MGLLVDDEIGRRRELLGELGAYGEAFAEIQGDDRNLLAVAGRAAAASGANVRINDPFQLRKPLWLQWVASAPVPFPDCAAIHRPEP